MIAFIRFLNFFVQYTLYLNTGVIEQRLHNKALLNRLFISPIRFITFSKINFFSYLYYLKMFITFSDINRFWLSLRYTKLVSRFRSHLLTRLSLEQKFSYHAGEMDWYRVCVQVSLPFQDCCSMQFAPLVDISSSTAFDKLLPDTGLSSGRRFWAPVPRYLIYPTNIIHAKV